MRRKTADDSMKRPHKPGAGSANESVAVPEHVIEWVREAVDSMAIEPDRPSENAPTLAEYRESWSVLANRFIAMGEAVVAELHSRKRIKPPL